MMQYWPRYQGKRNMSAEMRLGSHFQQWFHLKQCSVLVKKKEQELNITYDGILKLRDNTAVVNRFPPPDQGLEHVLLKNCAAWGGIEDKVVYAPRQYLQPVFESPLLVAEQVNSGVNESFARRFQNPEQYLKAVYDHYRIPTIKLSAREFPVVDARCDFVANETKHFCLVSRKLDCRPPRSEFPACRLCTPSIPCA